MLSIDTVTPIDKPKPGITRFAFLVLFILTPAFLVNTKHSVQPQNSRTHTHS